MSTDEAPSCIKWQPVDPNAPAIDLSESPVAAAKELRSLFAQTVPRDCSDPHILAARLAALRNFQQFLLDSVAQAVDSPSEDRFPQVLNKLLRYVQDMQSAPEVGEAVAAGEGPVSSS